MSCELIINNTVYTMNIPTGRWWDRIKLLSKCKYITLYVLISRRGSETADSVVKAGIKKDQVGSEPGNVSSDVLDTLMVPAVACSSVGVLMEKLFHLHWMGSVWMCAIV